MKLGKPWLVVAFLLLVFLGPVHFLYSARSANLTSVSVSMSTPRLSFSGILASGNTVGSSIVILNDTAGAAPSTSSANLFEGDTVLIGSSQYRVASPSASERFTITGLPSTPAINVLQTGDADAGDRVVASRSASFTVRFTTATAIANGSFRILVPAASTNANDALPDPDGWDYGGGAASAVSVTCPGDINVSGHQYDFVTGRATPSALVRGSQTYHAFECAYSGTGGNGSAFDGTTYGPIVIQQRLINPSPATDHLIGYSDTYPIIVEQLNGFTDGYTVLDSTAASVAVIESVRVTAVVSPQITFRILGQPVSTTLCGFATSVTSTPTLVPLGELLIDAFKYAAQELVVSTNAQNGYSVTASYSGQLRRFGATCPGTGCIPNSPGDNSGMTDQVTDEWLSTGTKGFAYSLENNTAASVAFSHNSAAGTCTGVAGNCFRQFSTTPREIFSSTAVADNQSAYVCYKSVVSSTQEAGSDYATDVTYRATATF